MPELTSLRSIAAAAHAAYPQYSGYFDGWILAEVTRPLNFHGAKVARGEVVLAAPVTECLPGDATPSRAFFNPETGWNCMADADAVAPLETYVRYSGGLVWFKEGA